MQNHVDLASEMASHWNQPQHNISDLIRLLKTVPAANFIEFSRIKEKLGRVFAVTFSPVMESMTIFMITTQHSHSMVEFLNSASNFDKSFKFKSQFALIVKFVYGVV